eukprot:TRINITY_DN25777_c0_g1_i5.p1 TRINITY_DN25777_c0_g1~~TRINITY_DN25777_c0_g1_i5.p1  ORF type:complete len:110 (+),score=10.63 TRINITY_DN25777_c0_g1_i5:77-406(+)
MCIRDRYFSMDGHLLSSTYTYTTLLEPVSAIKTCFFYFLFFIFVLFFFIYIYLFSIKSIFSIVCDTTSILDIVSAVTGLSLIHISEPTRLLSISYAVFCLKKKKKKKCK